MTALKSAKLAASSTLYVGNLTFYTSEEQLWELFRKCGEVKNIIMGLNKETNESCGFCFVEYETHDEAAAGLRYVNGTKLDDRIIRVDWDPGFVPGREFGRGQGGNQRRDQYRRDFDPGRGGYGLVAQKELIRKRAREIENEKYAEKKKRRQDTEKVETTTNKENEEQGDMDGDEKRVEVEELDETAWVEGEQ
jgi:nuclear cap-binding protein subunit 2